MKKLLLGLLLIPSVTAFGGGFSQALLDRAREHKQAWILLGSPSESWQDRLSGGSGDGRKARLEQYIREFWSLYDYDSMKFKLRPQLAYTDDINTVDTVIVAFILKYVDLRIGGVSQDRAFNQLNTGGLTLFPIEKK